MERQIRQCGYCRRLVPIRRVWLLKLDGQAAIHACPAYVETGGLLVDKVEHHIDGRDSDFDRTGLQNGHERGVIGKILRRRVPMNVEREGNIPARHFRIGRYHPFTVLQPAFVLDKVLIPGRKEQVFDETFTHRHLPCSPGVLAVDV